MFTAISSTRKTHLTLFSMALVMFFEEGLIGHFSPSSLLSQPPSYSFGGSRFRPLLRLLPLVPAPQFRTLFNPVIPVGTSPIATIQPWINSASSIPRLSAVIYIRETEFVSQMKSLP